MTVKRPRWCHLLFITKQVSTYLTSTVPYLSDLSFPAVPAPSYPYTAPEPIVRRSRSPLDIPTYLGQAPHMWQVGPRITGKHSRYITGNSLGYECQLKG